MKILSVFLALIICICCVSCAQSNTTSPPASSDTATTVSSPTTEEVLNEIYSEEERDEISLFIDSIQFVWYPTDSFQSYNKKQDSVHELSSIEIRGLPILLSKIFKLDNDWNQEYFSSETSSGGVLAADYYLTLHCTLRLGDYSCFPNATIGHNSKSVYEGWTKAKKRLDEIAKSNITADEKLNAYRKLGIFAAPYVKKEIENGNNELEDFFTLIGAHLSTKDYLLLVERNHFAEPHNISAEEYDALLLASAEGFDYKVWLSENEEDLDNLFKYLDAYCAEYEETNK